MNQQFWKDFLEDMPVDQAVQMLQEFQVNFHIGTVLIRNYDPSRLAFKIDEETGKVAKGTIRFG